jgi:HK97 gp10 family phage protein
MKNQVQGLAETIDALQKIGVEIDTEELRADIRELARPVIDTAKSLAPHDSGQLASSIGFITNSDAKYKYTVMIAPNLRSEHGYLALWYEFGGQSERFTKSGAHRGRIPMQPFMRPAFDMHKNRISEAINENIRKRIIDLAKKHNISTK